MTAEHLRPVLDCMNDAELLFHLANDLAQASVPPDIIEVIRLGRMTALQKSNGRVRGIVAGDILRRLVAKTIRKQLGPAIQAKSPFQRGWPGVEECSQDENISFLGKLGPQSSDDQGSTPSCVKFDRPSFDP